jgi:hypothetical protein
MEKNAEQSAGTENTGSDDSTSAEASVEQRAREMGWLPKEEFPGAPDNFIPADQFVERGEQMMPFVKAENRKLRGEFQAAQAELRQNRQLLQAANESIEELKNFNIQIARDRAKSRRSEIAGAIKEARESGDVEKELELTDELSELNETIREAEPAKRRSSERPNERPTGEDPQSNPEFRSWQEAHPWFGSDRRKTSVAMAIANELRESEPGLKGKSFLDKVAEETERTLGGNPKRNGSSRVEGSRSGAMSSSGEDSSGKSYADLPQDARDACERQSKRLVGEGRAFKNLQEWRKHYVKQYFNS